MGSTLELGPESQGSHHTVAVGDSVAVALPETPTTGFRWWPDIDPQRLRLVDDRFEGAASPRGAGGRRVLAFEALRPGPAQLRLAKAREWAADPRETFVVDLEVLPAD